MRDEERTRSGDSAGDAGSATEADSPPRFQRVDWAEYGGRTGRVTAERATLAVGLAVLLALYLYDTYVVHVYLVGTYEVVAVDWVFFLGLVVLAAYVAVPAARSRDWTRRVLAALCARRSHAAPAGFLGAITLVGVVGPFLLGEPTLRFQHRFHAPYGFTVDMGWTVECLGEVTRGEGIARYCHGSLADPLGTNHRGHSLTYLLVAGARVALYVVVFTAAFVVPLAAATGIAAGLRGGLVDDLLMGYVDAQLSIPAIVLYLVGVFYWNKSLLLLLAAFGLFSWGGVARLVRSETLQRREDGHVLIARSLGAPRRYVARKHVLPNVTNTVVPAAFHLFAMLVLVEAGVAFLGFHDVELYSWGSTIQEGLQPPTKGLGFEVPARRVWWISTFPAAALAMTLLSLKLVGDGLRDALDPKRG